MKDVKPVQHTYGLYLTIDTEFEKMLENMRKIEAEHQTDIVINYYGHVKEYSLEDFLNRLGIA